METLKQVSLTWFRAAASAAIALYLAGETDVKTRGYKNLTKFKGSSIEWLKAAPLDYYDFIYIDADHTAVGVLLDAELSWLCLKPGGVIAFDDYEWSDGKGDAFRPMPGINTFVDRHKNELTIIHKGWQLWVVKA